MADRVHELDVVKLLHPAGRWPAGTVGTVVDEGAERALVEIDEEAFRSSGIAEDEWLTTAVVEVPYSDLVLATPAKTTTR